MRARISADPGRGPGNGIIEIFDVGDTGEPGFTLLRASDGKSLGPRGWQESETLLTPDAWDNDGGSLRMAVGPAVVDEVDNLDAYRISLRGAGSCSLAVKSLVYSHIAGGHGMGAGAPLTAPVAAPIPAPVEPEPEPEPESPEPPLAFEEPQAQEAPLEMASKQDGKSGGKAGIIIALLLAAAAAGVAAWWFLLRQPEKPPLPTPSEQTQNAEKPQSPEQPKPADAAPQGTDAGKQALSPLASAREQLRGQALPDVSLAMAKPLRKADAKPEESDAAFLLLEDAAQKGSADAMFLVAQYYDPASTLPRGSIPADLTQAKRWYDQALQKGQPQAKAALDALKEHARALEAKGDAEARSLLQNWQ